MACGFFGGMTGGFFGSVAGGGLCCPPRLFTSRGFLGGSGLQSHLRMEGVPVIVASPVHGVFAA